MDTKKLADTYNKIARDYTKDHAEDTWDDDYINFFSEALFPNAKVLDLGCGPGFETQTLAAKGFAAEGFDLSDGLLKIARQKLPSATFTQGDMQTTLPYRNEYFDGVFAKASLLHIPKEKIGLVFAEISRILKVGGILHIALKKGFDEKEVVEDDYGYEYQRFFSYWQPENLEAIFSVHNLKIIKQDTWTKPGIKTVWLKYLLQK